MTWHVVDDDAAAVVAYWRERAAGAWEQNERLKSQLEGYERLLTRLTEERNHAQKLALDAEERSVKAQQALRSAATHLTHVVARLTSPTAEAPGSNPVQSGFESPVSYPLQVVKTMIGADEPE